ncbi:MAG: SdpI family protein [Clostridia bacterium]|nr:SdpI family protein [Clostridia bacterium]
MSQVSASALKCSACGAPLPLPNNPQGKVFCEYCGTANLIDMGNAKNREILEKNDINSGIPHAMSPAGIHEKLVSVLTGPTAMPLDVLEKANVIREEHICIPAFMFYCNAMASYNYDAGNIRERQEVVDNKVVTKQYTEYTQMSGIANVSKNVIASGSEKYTDLIKSLYSGMDGSRLVDSELLEFPSDTEYGTFDVPEAAVFSSQVQPAVNAALREAALDSLSGKDYKNLSVGGSNIQKEMKRIYLAVYKIVYEYREQVYTVFIDGDGKQSLWTKVPIDEARQTELNTYTEGRDKVSKTHRLFSFGAIIAGILGLILTFSGDWKIALGIAALAGCAACIVFYIRFKKKYDADVAAWQAKIDAFHKQRNDAVAAFKTGKKHLDGIYSNLE